jgi:hypothetical protein
LKLSQNQAPRLILTLILASAPGSAATAEPPSIRFVDRARELGLTQAGRSGSKDKLEIAARPGQGVCVLDYDRDGDPDLFLVGGGYLDGLKPTGVPNRLYRNEGGKFTEVSEAAGLAAPGGWGFGCAAADIDRDGDLDLYVAELGPNRLWRNDGGHFADITQASGAGDPRWTAGVIFADFNGDGWPDLFLANHARFDPAHLPGEGGRCPWKGLMVGCGPLAYSPDRSTLLLNRGGASFTDQTARAGMEQATGYAFQPLAFDADGDGDADILVANDSTANFLWRNRGDGTFEEVGLESGLALSEDGRPQAAMGIALGDTDGDGRLDLYITNFSDDYNTLYRNLGDGFFLDNTYPSGLGEATFPYLGWGTHFFDADQDGDLDLFVANGHVWPEADDPATGTWYRQKNQLFLGRGDGRFEEVSASAGPGLAVVESSRGSAVFDLEGDGDLDLVTVNQDAPPTLLVNETGGAGHYLAVELEGTQSSRDGLGAKLRLLAGGRTQVREQVGAASYLSQSQLREHFGLGDSTRIERLEILWPSGQRQVLDNLKADQLLRLREPNQ